MTALLSYTTAKLARFEDRRIGILRLLLVVSILAYVCIFQFAWKGEWAESDVVAGTSRLTIQQPTVGACDPAGQECLNAFRNKSELPYCSQSPCQFFAAPLPVGSEMNGATLAITRLQSIEQTNVCDHAEDNCPQIFVPTGKPESAENTYVADIESFTVGFDHTAWTTRTAIGEESSFDSVASRQKRGKLYVPKNDYLCTALQGHSGLDSAEPKLSAPCFLEPNTTRSNIDYFRLEVLLLAATSDSTAVCPLDQANFNNRT